MFNDFVTDTQPHRNQLPAHLAFQTWDCSSGMNIDNMIIIVADLTASDNFTTTTSERVLRANCSVRAYLKATCNPIGSQERLHRNPT